MAAKTVILRINASGMGEVIVDGVSLAGVTRGIRFSSRPGQTPILALEIAAERFDIRAEAEVNGLSPKENQNGK